MPRNWIYNQNLPWYNPAMENEKNNVLDAMTAILLIWFGFLYALLSVLS